MKEPITGANGGQARRRSVPAFAETMTLREVFQHAKCRTLPKEWLYLPADAEWTPATDGVFLDWENEEKDTDEIPI